VGLIAACIDAKHWQFQSNRSGVMNGVPVTKLMIMGLSVTLKHYCAVRAVCLLSGCHLEITESILLLKRKEKSRAQLEQIQNRNNFIFIETLEPAILALHAVTHLASVSYRENY